MAKQKPQPAASFKFADYQMASHTNIESLTLEETLDLDKFVKWAQFKAKINQLLEEQQKPPLQTYHLKQATDNALQTPHDAHDPPPSQKLGGTWLIRPKALKDYFKAILDRVTVLPIPDTVRDANDLIKTDGIYSWNQISQNFPPFTFYGTSVPVYIENHFKDITATRKTCGIWRDPQHNAWLVDMPKFVPWFFTTILNDDESKT